MERSNYPDDIRSYDNDSRSPFYNDRGEEKWCENRYTELLEDINELELDGDELLEVVYKNYDDKADPDKIKLLAAIVTYIEGQAGRQADDEWSDK